MFITSSPIIYLSERKESCKEKVEDSLLDLLLPGSDKKSQKQNNVLGNIFGVQKTQEKSAADQEQETQEKQQMNSTSEKFRAMLREGKLEDREVEISVTSAPRGSMSIFTGGSLDDIESAMQNIQEMMNGARKKLRTVTVAEARKILTEQILDSMVDADKAADIAKERVEQSGIIFIDEIDKKVGGTQNDISGINVLHSMLKLIEDATYNIMLPAQSMDDLACPQFRQFSTKNIIVIFSGAFSGINEIVEKRLNEHTVGFVPEADYVHPLSRITREEDPYARRLNGYE